MKVLRFFEALAMLLLACGSAWADRFDGYILHQMLLMGRERMEMDGLSLTEADISTLPLGTAVIEDEGTGDWAEFSCIDDEDLLVSGSGRYRLVLGGEFTHVKQVSISCAKADAKHLLFVAIGAANHGELGKSDKPLDDFSVSAFGTLVNPYFQIEAKGGTLGIHEVNFEQQFRRVFFTQDEFTVQLNKSYQRSDYPFVGGDGVSDDKGITYRSTNPQVATINNNRDITLLATGRTTIIATIPENGFWPQAEASYVLIVENGPEMPDNPISVQGTSETVTLSAPGTLRLALAQIESDHVSSLTIRGPLNTDDILLLREAKGRLSELQELNLKEATVAPDSKSYASLEVERSEIGTTTHVYILSDENREEVKSEPNGNGGVSIIKRCYNCNLGGMLSESATLHRIVLPEWLTTLGDHFATSSPKLEEVVPGSGLHTIGAGAFESCSQLHSVAPFGATVVESSAFANTALFSLNLSHVEMLGSGAFANTRLEKADLSRVKDISNNAFDGCNRLAQVEWCPTLDSIGYGAFSECTSLIEANFSACPNLRVLGERSFYNCTSLQTLALGERTDSIGPGAFMSCTSLADLKLNTGLRAIGEQAFNGCTSLSSVFLPKGLQKLYPSAFLACSSLCEVSIPASLESLLFHSFYSCPLRKIYLYGETPIQSNDTNKFIEDNKRFAEVYVLPHLVKTYQYDPFWTHFNIFPMDDAHLALSINQPKTSAPSTHQLFRPNGTAEKNPRKGGLYIKEGKKILWR